MSTVDILIEVQQGQDSAFSRHAAAIESDTEATNQAEALLSDLAGFGVEVMGDYAPVPLFSEQTVRDEAVGFAAFASPDENPDASSESVVVSAQVERARLDDLAAQPNITVWPNPELTLYQAALDLMDVDDLEFHPFDLARSGGGVDCRPFSPAVTIEIIRELLGVEVIWRDGFRGQNIIVGIIDEGVNGRVYPVVGGFSGNPNAQRPGSAPITSHGSMCAADVLVAAPAAKIYDYPFLGVPNSGGALRMYQAVLEQRRVDGTPHLTNNSYGFVGRPSQFFSPNHPVWDINHPQHRKMREVVASGAPAFFAAGNCGADCPSGNCLRSGIGPGNSIHATNSLVEVITVAAVNKRHERIGYSSQGPGGFEPDKPDVAAYSHFFGNFGPGRPGGTAQPFDNGTSAATPVAAGVGALLLSAIQGLSPQALKEALIAGTADLGPQGWDTDTGHGVINAAASYAQLTRDC